MSEQKKIWLVSREYDGIAEAGGVKNVTTSLAENLCRTGIDVTVIMPLYKCTKFDLLRHYEEDVVSPAVVKIDGKEVPVRFNSGIANGVKIILVNTECFAEKKGVYTYTWEDEKENYVHVKGTGHFDVLYMNTVFQKAVVEYAKKCIDEEDSQNKKPDVIHCQDAACAMVPVFANIIKKLRQIKYIVTIHNAGPGYHHEYYSMDIAERLTGLSGFILEKGINGQAVEPFLLAGLYADITTVSPWYAEEIMNGTTETQGLSEGFKKLGIKITGITNGIDSEKYLPEKKEISLLPYEYSPGKCQLEGKYANRQYFLEHYASRNACLDEYPEIRKYGFISTTNESEKTVYVSYHGRIVSQKGIDILQKAAVLLLEENLNIRFIFMGQGEQSLEKALAGISEKYTGRCVYFLGYERALTRLCTAAADFAVFPSNFEPCGLEDFIAQIYGTVPVAHATGGLCKIKDGGTGFLYKENNEKSLAEAIKRACEYRKNRSQFINLIQNAALSVNQDYSWKNVIRNSYMQLYF